MLRVLPLVLLGGCSLLTTLSDPTSGTDANDAGIIDGSAIVDSAVDASTIDASDHDSGVDAGPIPIVFVQSISSAASTTLSLTKPVTAGSLLVVAVTTNDTGTDPITGVSDSSNGNFTRAISYAYLGGHIDLYYFADSLAGDDTVTAVGSGAVVIAEYRGVAKTDPLDQVAGATGQNATSFSAGPTAMLSGPNELVLGIGGETAAASGSFAAGSGFTMRDQTGVKFDYETALEDRIATTTAGAVMTMTGANNDYGTLVAAFKTP